MKFKFNPFVRSTALVASFVISFGASAFGGTYQWSGATSSDWSTATNWPAASGITAGVPPTSGTHRINIQNGTAAAPKNPAIFNFPATTMTYGGNTIKGLVIGNGNNTNGDLQISAGTLSTGNNTVVGSSLYNYIDVVGNGTGAKATLILNGGNYISGASGMSLGLGGGPTSEFTLNSASSTATVTTLGMNATTATINLNAGMLEVNKIEKLGGTGTLNLSGGTLKARQNNTAFVTGLSAVNINSAGAIIDTNTFDVTIGNVLKDGGGGGGLTKNSTGKLILTAAPTYTGPTVINAGTLEINPSSPFTYNNNISGAGSLSIGGAVTLGGANTYLGATNVSAGSLTLNGSLTSDVTVASGVNFAGEGSTTGILDFTGTSLITFDTSTPGALTAASIDATGATISVAPIGSVTGPGIVVLQAAGGITGVIGSEFIGNSRLSLSYNETQTQLLADYTPAMLTWKGNDGTNPTYWDTNVTANWDHSGTPDKFLAGDNVLFDDTATSFTVDVQSSAVSGNMIFNHSLNNYTVNGATISGGASLTKNGTGVLTLNSPNTYTGATTINAGTVIAGNNSALGSTVGGTTVASGAILDINGKKLGTEVITISGNGDGSGALISSGAEQIEAIGRLVLGADAAIGGSGARWDIRNSSPTLDMGASSPFTLSKVGSNYIGLVGVAVSNPGNIDITQGTLSVQTSTNLGGSSANTITVRSGAILSSWQASNPTSWSLVMENSSTLRAENAAVGTHNTWSGPITLQDSGAITIDAIATMTISGVISGTDSTINKTGAGVTFLSGSNNYTGLTTVSGGSLVLQNTSALGTTDAGTSVTGTARVELDHLTISGESITIAGEGGNYFGALQGRAGTSVWAGDVNVDGNLTRIGTQAGASLEVSGVISSTSNHNVVFRPANDASPVILTGENTYTGPTSVVGGVVSVSHIGSVNAGTSNFGAPTTVEDGTIKMSVASATGTLRYTGTDETTDRVVDLSAPTNGAYLDQSGTGLLKFTSDMTATGAGTKNLALQGSTAGVGELAGAIVDNSSTNKTTLSKGGTGTWTLSGNNTFTGGVTISGGILKITNSNGLGTGAKTVTINATGDKWLELDGSNGDITLASDVSFQTSGLNGVIRSTAGDNVINGNFTMTVGNGNTKIISDNTGSLTLNGNIAANTATRVLDFGGDSTANNVFNGVLSNTSTPALTKSGIGKWILNGTNLYTGATTITGGTLVLGATGSIDASTSLTIAAGAKLDTTAKPAHTLPSAVVIDINGTSDASGLIDAAGQALDIDGAAVTFNVVNGTLTAPAYVLANYGSISGTAAFASATAPAGYTLDYAYNSGTQIALVQLTATAYDTWIDSFFSGETDLAIIGKDADPDGDGANNLIEFALKGIPNDASNNGLYASLVQDASAPTGNELTLVAAVRDGATFANSGSPVVQTATVDGMVYSIEGSVDLVTLPGSAVSHATGPADTAPAATGLPDLTGTDWEYHTFKLDVSEGLGGKGFLRAKIETAP